MKKTLLACLVIILLAGCGTTREKSTLRKLENYKWFKFEWISATVGGVNYPKIAMTVPVKINDLPVNFILQFDLGLDQTTLYGNALKSYYSAAEVNRWLNDSSGVSGGLKQPGRLWNFKMSTGDYNVEKIYIRENYGKPVLKDSLYSKTQKHIGSLGADAFKDKILVIDYPNMRMCVLDSLDKFWKKQTQFIDAQTKRGRLHIPLTINGKVYWFLYDTGSSIFPVSTDKTMWSELTESNAKTDTLKVPSWGEMVTFYGRPISQKVYIGERELSKSMGWYNENQRLLDFNKSENISGVLGNVYFFDEIVLLDFKNIRFGLVKRGTNSQ